MSTQGFLLEIGCEEIPVSAQLHLSSALKDLFSRVLSENKLAFCEIKTFATPRRLAILICDLETTQAPQKTERQGPAVQDAYDQNGTPTLVCLGFAKSCGVSIDQLIVRETPKGKRLICLCEKPGAQTKELLPNIITKVISKLPLSKPMRWGNHAIHFIRPVHWVIALFGEELIHTTILGKKTTRETAGHRFHHPHTISIQNANDYPVLLYSQGFVIADFNERKNLIKKYVVSAVDANQKPLIDENLLNEVTALVEWPVVLKGTFDSQFLTIPKECLITAMQTHQKCFPVIDADNKLLPYFILVSNIVSKNAGAVIQGNERVIRARLEDAAFFYHQDCKKKLSDRLPRLDQIVFQDQLGSVGDKIKRLMKLSMWIAKKIKADSNATKRAAQLCKCDLVSDMVLEFPNLQGTMGYYYALNDHEKNTCADAINEHYFPKFSGDQLPASNAGYAIALADRIDTLVGILGMNKMPTGDKDPFALRRAAHGVFRILIEKGCVIDLLELLREAKKLYINVKLTNKNVISETYDFIMARLKAWYSEQGIAVEIFESVMARAPTSPLDFDKRLKAVLQFQTLPEANSLAAANKRVSNILKKQIKKEFKKTDVALFEFEAERILSKKLTERTKIVNALYAKANYEKALTELSSLKEPIDQFFDSVMIMVDDEKKKQNRLALLSSIRTLFTKVADISLLP